MAGMNERYNNVSLPVHEAPLRPAQNLGCRDTPTPRIDAYVKKSNCNGHLVHNYVLQSNCLFVPSGESEPPVRCMSKTERLRRKYGYVYIYLRLFQIIVDRPQQVTES